MPGSTTVLADSSNVATNEEVSKVQIIGRESYMAVAFMSGLNRNNTKYQEWVNELANAYAYGRDEYPKDLVVAYRRSIERKGHVTTSQCTSRSNNSVLFVTEGQVEPGIFYTEDVVLLLKRNGEPVVCFICETII